MSVVSKNPFDLLDDGEDRSTSPAPKAAAAGAGTKTAPVSKQPKVVPGAAQRGGRGARAPTGQRPTYTAGRGEEGFDGERVAPTKKEHGRPDRHTKGPRAEGTGTGPRSRAPGAAGARGPKGGARGGRGGAAGAPGAEKRGAAAPTESWGNDEGKAELSAEKQGEKDAVDAGADTPAQNDDEEAEPEDNSKTLDQYLAEKAAAALGGGLGKKETRQVKDDVEGKQFEREEVEFFAGKAKPEKEKKEKKAGKQYIAVDGQFASPARAPRGGERGDRPARGGGRGGPRGGARGSGAPRGGAAPRAPRQAAVDTNDEKSFPTLGSK